MKLEGIHHITAITGDAVGNVEFYTGVLGLRMVKQTVNQDDPTVYHLFYGDDDGSPGMDLTFFEYPGAVRGTPGAGMVHRIVWRVGTADAVAFWAKRLAGAGAQIVEQSAEQLRFADPEGLEHELILADSDDAPLRASAPGIPPEHALQGFAGVRAYSTDPQSSAALLCETLGFSSDDGERWEVRGEQRGSFYAYDAAPPDAPAPGAGSVHHVAFASQPDDEQAWQTRVAESGQARPTTIIDRFYFRSVYFREPSGVLFEIATIGPGFAVDEDAAHLGERLSLPPRFEPLRERLQGVLKPLPYPRAPDA